RNNAEDIGPGGSAAAPWYPYPDVTFAPGEAYKRVAVESLKLPESSVAVTGDPRHDEVFWYKQRARFYRKEFLARYGLPDRPIVMLATQPFIEEAERVDFVRTAIEALRLVSQCHL